MTTAEQGRVPFEIGLGLRLGLGPVATGLLVTFGLVAGALAFYAVVSSGGLEVDAFVSVGFATRAALVASLGTGYVFAATRLGSLGAHRDLRALGLVPDEESESEEVVHRVPPEALVRSRIWGAVGIAFFLVILEIPNVVADVGLFGAWSSLHVLVYLQGLGLLFFFFAGRAAYFSLRGMRGLAAFVDGELAVDLLDLRPLAIFGRAAVRNCLLWLISFSIGSLVFLNPELSFRDSLVVFVPIFVVNSVIAGLALWLPMRSVHDRVSAAKNEELARVDAALRGDREAIRDTRIAHWAGAGLGDLLEYRSYVADLRSWPYEGPALGRIALFVLIPVGSWIGGALVERLVESALR